MTTFAPICPTTDIHPTRIAPDTYVIHQVQPALGQPLFVYINSMVILGKEPVIVDTGTPGEPKQVARRRLLARGARRRPLDLPFARRRRSTGNLDEALDCMPQREVGVQLGDGGATHELLRLPARALPMGRARRDVRRGRPDPAGVAPTVFDSPTTRGLFDSTTGVYWAVDTFATPLPRPRWLSRSSTRSSGNSGCACSHMARSVPWLSMLDIAKYGRYVDAIGGLDIMTVASCHSPTIEGPFIEKAFAIIRQLPAVEPPPLPDQSILDQIIGATSQPAS